MSSIGSFYTQGLSLTVQNASVKSPEAESTVVQFMKFMDAAKEGPGGFMRAQILASMNVTEEDIAGMTPEDREKIEHKIKELIEKKIEEARKEAAEKEAVKRVELSSPQKLDLKTEARALTAEEKDRMDEVWRMQFLIPLGKPDNHPDNIYGTVKVNGKVVATLYNGGGAETSNMSYSKLKNLPSMGVDEQTVGPELAQKRAEEIAAALGGTIEKAGTAQTQAQWRAIPPMEWTYDYKAMEAAQKLRDEALTARRYSSPLWLDAQLLGQQDT